MTQIKERMKQFLTYKGVSDYSFEKEIGLSKGYMNKCKNPTGEVLEKMCGIYSELSAEWLLRGIEPMIIEKSTDNNIQSQPSVSSLDSQILDLLAKKDAQMERLIALLENK